MSSTLVSQLTEFIADFEVEVFLRPFIKTLQIIITGLSLLTDNSQYYPQLANVTAGQVFDYIVIGAGSAGCVVANRLSENPNSTVLLIDAGDVPSLATDYLGLFFLLDRTEEEWNYYSTDDGYSSQAHLNKVIHMTAGRMIGGSGSINYNVYKRGVPSDYNRWLKLGNPGWGWKSVLKYFKKSEYLDDVPIYNSDTASLHGKNGPMHVRRPEWTLRSKNYLEGFAQAGYDTLLDINGYKHIGYGMSQFYGNGINRQSTAITYLRPIRNRGNINLLLNAMVTKVVIDEDKVATGVEALVQNDKLIYIKASKEVIVCGGALNSPKLLMLSGVGPAQQLKGNNINVFVDSPGVGQNLIDTPLTFVSLTGDGGFLNTFGRNVDLLANLDKFPNPLFIGHGVLNKSQCCPDYQTNVFPVPAGSLIAPIFYNSIFTYDNEITEPLTQASLQGEIVIAAHSFLQPRSRGCITLQSNDPKDAPIIKTGYYSNPRDLELHARCIEDYVNVTTTDVFKSFNSEVIYITLKECEGLELGSHEYWKCYALNTVGPMFNFAGTCAMGPGYGGVVDARLRVKGVKGLRVADASVIPTPIRGNFNAAVVMIAEKVSDMIKEDNSG